MPYSDKKIGLYDQRFEHDSCGVGFVVDIHGKRSVDIIKQGLGVLKRLSHRGAVGADPDTGDGAGILIQIPHEFYAKQFELPEPGAYGTGLVFLPTDKDEKQFCKEIFSKIAEEEGRVILGWREVPVDNSKIGRTARETQPAIEQVFIEQVLHKIFCIEGKWCPVFQIWEVVAVERFFILNLIFQAII